MPSQDPDELREEALSSLFDDTAEAPSEIERARLSAHAVAVAEKRGRARLRVARVVWPLSVSAAAAVAYLVIAPAHRSTDVVPSAASATSSALAPHAAPSVVANGRTDLPEAPAVEAEDPVVAVLGGPEDLFDLGPLMDDRSAREEKPSMDSANSGAPLTRSPQSALEMNERR